ncbi:MAG TPA: HypC/HybG/HupF family hydrogenase formation chaperone [Gemmatimonadaceae bacterium]|nr:HypC/HybG/HupF family hydrogenase formation chaperone [Gemmatimonadaceae bacterium]
MCLGVPGRVISVNGGIALVDFWGARRETRLDVVDEPVQPGDYILNHVGFAIRRIPPEEIRETLALYEQLLNEAGDDMMAADVRGEMDAAPSRELQELPLPDAPACPVGFGLGGALAAHTPDATEQSS